MKWIDLVIVDVDVTKLLCRAPRWSHLKKGDKVVLCEQTVEVVASDTFSTTDKSIKMILNAFDFDHLKEVPKLTANVIIDEFIYDDEDEEEGGETDERNQ